jgi:hypothetical protein
MKPCGCRYHITAQRTEESSESNKWPMNLLRTIYCQHSPICHLGWESTAAPNPLLSSSLKSRSLLLPTTIIPLANKGTSSKSSHLYLIVQPPYNVSFMLCEKLLKSTFVQFDLLQLLVLASECVSGQRIHLPIQTPSIVTHLRDNTQILGKVSLGKLPFIRRKRWERNISWSWGLLRERLKSTSLCLKCEEFIWNGSLEITDYGGNEIQSRYSSLEDIRQIVLPQDRVQWRSLLLTVLNVGLIGYC